MAKAIRQIREEIPNSLQEKEEAVDELLKELADNREAIIGAIRILRELQEMRALETIGAMLDQRQEVGAIAIQQINQPTMHNVIKSGISAFKFLGSLQPSELETMMEGVGNGMKRLSETAEEGEKQSFWKMRKRLRTPEIRAAITTMINFMEGMGEVFLKKRAGK